jgi:hypothetical protein
LTVRCGKEFQIVVLLSVGEVQDAATDENRLASAATRAEVPGRTAVRMTRTVDRRVCDPSIDARPST